MQDLAKINPLNVLGCREVDNPPPYFEYIYIDLKYNIVEPIREWIYENLKHRFYMGTSLELEHNQYVVKIKIGFEEPKEASFFLIACSLLKYSEK
jgi:hypothetical protein